jgi:hypothetical protein
MEPQKPLNGFSICPFLKSSTYNVIECSISEIEPIENYDAIVFIVEDDLSLEEMKTWTKHYNEKHPEWLFFEDHSEHNTYIANLQTNNGVYNLIIAQPKEKLLQLRKALQKTDYYSFWPKEYYEQIVGESSCQIH